MDNNEISIRKKDDLIIKIGEDNVSVNLNDMNRIPTLISEQKKNIEELQAKVEEADKKAKEAKERADYATGLSSKLGHHTEAIQGLQDAQEEMSDAVVLQSEAQKALQTYQTYLTDFTSALFSLGITSIAMNRTVVREIKAQLLDAPEEELDEMARQEMLAVFQQLKAQEDIMLGLEKAKKDVKDVSITAIENKTVNERQDNVLISQSEVIVKHDNAIAEQIKKDEEYDRILAERVEKDEEHDRALAEQVEKDAEHDRVLAEQAEKDAEHDRVLAEQAEKDAEHDKALAEQVEKDAEHDRVLAEQAEKDEEHDRILAEQVEKDAEHDRILAEQEAELKTVRDKFKEFEELTNKKNKQNMILIIVLFVLVVALLALTVLFGTGIINLKGANITVFEYIPFSNFFRGFI